VICHKLNILENRYVTGPGFDPLSYEVSESEADMHVALWRLISLL
jgi:hypothetical protein